MEDAARNGGPGTGAGVTLGRSRGCNQGEASPLLCNLELDSSFRASHFTQNDVFCTFLVQFLTTNHCLLTTSLVSRLSSLV